MASAPTESQLEFRPTRSYRLGGYALSFEAARPWASRLRNFNFSPAHWPTVMMTIASEMETKHRILFRLVGENDSLRFMFVTQFEKFNGYKDMPSSEIPQFEPCSLDKTVLNVLREEGITEYEYQTVLD